MTLYKDHISSTNYLPSRKEVLEKFQALIDGNITREEISDWTNQWIINDHPPIKDFVVWEALDCLCGADLLDIDGSYLHDENDIISWLNKFQQACILNPEK